MAMKTSIIKKMHLSIFIILFIFVFLFTGLSSAGCSQKNPDKSGKNNIKKNAEPQVILLKSKSSIDYFGWKGAQEFESAGKTLQRLGISYKIIDENELVSGNYPKVKIIVLANTRCMSSGSVKAIEKFVAEGGKVFATYMSGYRDEKNQKINGNNFALCDIYGADYYSWIQEKPKCEYIKTEDGKTIQLGRNQAMLVVPQKDSETSGIWFEQEKKEQKVSGRSAAAVVFNKKTNSIYCGEDLFAPENASSKEVLELTAYLFEKMSPGITDSKKIKEAKNLPPSIAIPGEIIKSVKAKGSSVIIGISGKYNDIVVSMPGDGIFKASDGTPIEKPEKVKDGSTYFKKIPELPAGQKNYRIRAVSVEGKKPYIAIYDEDGNMAARATNIINFSSKKSQFPVSIIEYKQNGTYNPKVYRGSMSFTPLEDGNISLKNILSLDEYLAGVVPGEVPATYPAEALKAMAVVARTFAISTKLEAKHKKDGCDLCPTVHCQVYKGVMQEQLSTNKAVAETSGIVLEYNGKPAFTPFHAVCGGFEAKSSSAWSMALPYLDDGFDGSSNFNNNLSDEKNVKDFINNPPDCFCSNAGRFRWKQEFKKEDFEKMLCESIGCYNGRGRMDIGKLYSMNIKSRAADGRVLSVEIVTSEGVYAVSKDKIRWLTSAGKIGTDGLPSTLFYIEQQKDKITFHGGGWGHGVGMCQEGAKGMALAGKKFDEIVKHYYKGAELKSVD